MGLPSAPVAVSKRDDHPVVLDLPHAAPVAPRAFDQAVVERQGHDIEAEVGRALHVAVAAEDVGADAEPADVTGGKQRDAERAHVRRADGVLGRAHAPDQRRGLLLGEHLGDALELRAGHAGDPLDLFRVPLVDFLAGIIHAVHTLADELLVLPAVLEHVPEQSVDDRNVGAGTDAHIFGGVRRRAGEARVDDDVIRPVELLALEQVLQRDRMRFRRIAAHDHHGLGVADVVVGIGHRAVAPGIGYAGDRSRMADARLMVDVVGAPEGRELAIEIGAFVRKLRRAEPVDRIRSRLPANGRELVADLVDRLVPRHPGPLAVDQLHRVAQAAVAVHDLAHRGALGAVRAAVERAFPARLLADPHAVRHLGDDRAADRAMGADVLAQLDRGARGRRRPGFSLADAAERQRAERGKTAGSKPRPAQECAAIESAARMGCEHRGERAAT